MWRQTNESERERDILWIFDLALVLKAVGGAVEVLGALLVLFVPPALFVRIIDFVMAGELTQDPHDPVASVIHDAAQAFSVNNHLLITLYIVFHGAIKILLVIGIFAKKRMAYPLFMLALALFGTYEAYRGFTRHELLLQLLAAFDFSLLVLTLHEYRQRYLHSFSRDTQEGFVAR
ncbi:MAG: DUF2127 domain-containing protein [Patescibacteria group bacterium]|nr:DUF2127 domain-containing protein [Patescibacteria group bacterium]